MIHPQSVSNSKSAYAKRSSPIKPVLVASRKFRCLPAGETHCQTMRLMLLKFSFVTSHRTHFCLSRQTSWIQRLQNQPWIQRLKIDKISQCLPDGLDKPQPDAHTCNSLPQCAFYCCAPQCRPSTTSLLFLHAKRLCAIPGLKIGFTLKASCN